MTVPAQRVHDLFQDVDRDDPDAKETLSQIIDQYEGTLTDAFDMVAITRQLQVDSLAGASKSARMVVEERYDSVRQHLYNSCGDDALERLLVDVVAVNQMAGMYAAAMSSRACKSQKEIAFRSKLADLSTKRLAISVAMLIAYRQRVRP